MPTIKRKENFFNGSFWREVINRLEEFVPQSNLEQFSNARKLGSFRFDLVMTSGKGLTVESFVKVCRTLGLSPAYLLFAMGPKTLSELASSDAARDLPRKEDRREVLDVFGVGLKKVAEGKETYGQTSGHVSQKVDSPETRSVGPAAPRGTKGRSRRGSD